MDLAIQIVANDKTVKSDTVQGSKEFINQSLATQAEQGEQLVSMMPAIKKSFYSHGWWYSRNIHWKRCFEK